MATKEERRALNDEYDAAEAATVAAFEQYQADTSAETAAIEKTTASRAAWLEKLRHEHEVEDRLEAMQAAHEPPALPE